MAVFFGQVLVVDAVHTERAFLHHAFGLIELARAVRAGPSTKAAADAVRLVHQYDPVFNPLIAGTRGAYGDAGRIFAV